MAVQETKVYLPKQEMSPNRGKAGYIGENVVIVDRAGSTEPAAKSARAATQAAKKGAKGSTKAVSTKADDADKGDNG